MERRVLGKTGHQLSVAGFGGIVVMNETPEDAARWVAKAVEEYDINYFDVAPTYGNAEERLGPALEPYRKDIFLACKNHKRDRAGAQADLDNSFKLLKTDYFDLYQFHNVHSMACVDEILGKGGAMEVVLEFLPLKNRV